MKTYSVSYDLKAPGRNYQKLYEELQKSPSWAHPLESTWLIQTRENARDLFERLHQHMDKNDLMLVMEVGSDYWGVLAKNIWEWITSHIKKVLRY